MSREEIIPNDRLRKINGIAQAKLFLGREFLTWLWYLAEEKNKLEISSPESGETHFVEIWIDDRILLESTGGTSHENLMKGGSPSHSLEASAALEEGKSVKELKLGLRIDDLGDFVTNLNCNQLSPKSLQLPVSSDDEDSQINPLTTRIHNTNLFMQILDGLFLMFVEERTDKEWENTGANKIQDWIKKRSSKSGAMLH